MESILRLKVVLKFPLMIRVPCCTSATLLSRGASNFLFSVRSIEVNQCESSLIQFTDKNEISSLRVLNGADVVEGHRVLNSYQDPARLFWAISHIQMGKMLEVHLGHL